MSSTTSSVTPQLGGLAGVALFLVTVLAFVAESQLTQYVQTDLHYHKPFFIFYLVHSALAITFPLHLLYLSVTSKHSIAAILRGLRIAISNHLSPDTGSGSKTFPYPRFLWLVLLLTFGITCPSILWFAAISLASVSDVTAIWNTNAFFAYLITVQVFKLQWEARKLIAVVIATLGVAVVVYGGVTSGGEATSGIIEISSVPSAPVVGSILTLVASIGYGLYQVLYKMYAALPSDPEAKQHTPYQPIPDDGEIAAENEEYAVHHPPLGLHADLLTSLIGVATFLVLWIFIPVLHKTGVETFRWPSDRHTVLSIVAIALTGVVFNAGLMMLLSIWGPIITSVGNLLSIVVVVIYEVIFGDGLATLTVWSLLGCGVIVLAFGVLAYDMFTQQPSE
ncbi:hypothetical protein AGABI1DRAFT_51463 [Agaricus bisporus var. burnettii JB137-S8]|uniref:EamA domain-containing protein n=1 Tax=Agaricus bisporus var. burnettii (strain JB137-S8 / ATCC MYA-4627 / FGSC 10392) TaxID=597362 RepID=K5X7J7_AGABU|nr:uncharacterized protein AGABI1DRAFT_51463 [Agaricus bisporus var. burnettii JB137-S8]EKM83896.1 hypothetical protein AGABI1DRAFT_51463 [Agaricus bisporus var. burnettii JB137-S8]